MKVLYSRGLATLQCSPSWAAASDDASNAEGHTHYIANWPAVFAAGLLAINLSCHRPQAGGTPDSGGAVPISATIERHSGELLEIPGVVGVAEGEANGRPVLHILVARRTPELMSRLPRTLDGHPVVVIESGEIRAR